MTHFGDVGGPVEFSIYLIVRPLFNSRSAEFERPIIYARFDQSRDQFLERFAVVHVVATSLSMNCHIVTLFLK